MSNGFYINEMFASLEGEGPSVGTPTYFIRLQGCDIGCSWCDTKKAMGIKQEGTFIDCEALKEKIPFSPRYSITGGNPLLQDINILAVLCLEVNPNAEIHLEHPGIFVNKTDLPYVRPVYSLFTSVGFDLKPPSSGTDYYKFDSIVSMKAVEKKGVACYVKVPVFSCEDLGFAKPLSESFSNSDIPIFISLGDGPGQELKINHLVKTVTEVNHKNFRLGFQMHKLLGFA